MKAIEVFLVGGGGNGGNGGGGGGGFTVYQSIDVRNKSSIDISVGSSSSDTCIPGINTATHGQDASGFDCNGGNGGSGGGALYDGYDGSLGGFGGSDGSNGSSSHFTGVNSYLHVGGAGQGTTTRAFGEPEGTLYSGGGGGGYIGSGIGYGGSGGGGNGVGASRFQNDIFLTDGTAGQAGTGGGGGGAAGASYGGTPQPGGSGIVIVRW